MLRSSSPVLLSLLGVALAASTFACSGKTADKPDVDSSLQAVKKTNGQPTGDGKTCSWGDATTVGSPPVATPGGGSSGGCDTAPDGSYNCWSYDSDGNQKDLPTKTSTGWSGSSSGGSSSGGSSGGCTTDDKGNTSCWTYPSDHEPTPTPVPTPIAETYQVGDWFPALDSCNKCTCTDIGIMCTVQACAEPPVTTVPPVLPVKPPPPSTKGCEVDGKWLDSGTRFGAGDGCNTCSCGPDGQVSCTEMGCVEPGPPVSPPSPKK